MSGNGTINLRWTLAAATAVALFAAGAGVTYVMLPPREPAAAAPGAAGPAVAASASDAAGDVIVPVSREAIERAGITSAPVIVGDAAGGLTLPASVEVNAYKQTAVTAFVAGRITRVLVELGEHVQRGQPMAQVFSPELAEARARYVSARAELEAHERELQRTQKLVEIGAASRQDLERLHAEHTAQTAMVQSARSRLELLGAAAPDDGAPMEKQDASTVVRAPIGGIVIERLANPGMNVDAAAKLFTIADLSSVWIVGDLYEKDFARVRVGTPATVTTAAYPDVVLRAEVSYIDPQVSAETRTAKVRVEVANAGNTLRLGMYADMALAPRESGSRTLVPRAAVQSIGDRQVVYLVNTDDPGTFREREVHLGPPAGTFIEVLSGVNPGDVVVTGGSFYVRAERERLGLRPTGPAGRGSSDSSTSKSPSPAD